MILARTIHTGQWIFYPEFLGAQNIHNGNWAQFQRTPSGGWSVVTCNCPATWMLEELADWFSRWINGASVTDGKQQ